MPKPTSLAPAQSQSFSRNPKMKPPKGKLHPAVKQGAASFARLHGGKTKKAKR